MSLVAGKKGLGCSVVADSPIQEVRLQEGRTIALAGCSSYKIPLVFVLKDADSKYRPLFPCRVLTTSSTTTQTMASEAIAKQYDNTPTGLADNPSWDGELGFIDESAGIVVTETSGAAVITFASRATAAITSSGTPNYTAENAHDCLTVGGFTTGNTAFGEIGFLMNPIHINKNEDMATDMIQPVLLSGTLDYSKLDANAKTVVDMAFAHPEIWTAFFSKFNIINRES